jgi:alpha/beta hydrolase family protein
VARRLIWCVITAALATAGLTGVTPTAADGAGPTVTGPIAGGNGAPVIFAHTTFDLADVGYTQSEYFVSGTADAYAPSAPLGTDGRWSVAPTAQAPFTTRILVNRPIDRRDFNGTVVVEWLNVTGGADASPDWIHTHNELIREGYVWVGVSAQAVGVNALKAPASDVPPFGDPIRYAPLSHPGDSYSYDIFTQAGEAVREQAATVLGGLRPRQVLAVGESQSAGRLVTYINAVHPVADVYDGFLVHSRGGAGAALSQAPLAAVPVPAPTLLRTDLPEPVLQFQTETDLITLGFVAARQPDTSRIATWEVAGTAHFDYYGLVQGATDTGTRPSVSGWFDSMRTPTNQPSPNFTCGVPINTGPQTFVLRAAVATLLQWVARGKAPRSAPRLQTAGTPAHIVRDADGIALGGIRTPAVDAPVATLSGLGQTGGTQFCNIFGTTVPFTDQQLAARYRTHGHFAAAWAVTTIRASFDGYIRPVDAFQLVVVGAQSEIGR